MGFERNYVDFAKKCAIIYINVEFHYYIICFEK
jgi:hypothetical protein